VWRILPCVDENGGWFNILALATSNLDQFYNV